MPSLPRYLVRFDPKRLPHYFTDVLVIGGGLAGLRAALAAESVSTGETPVPLGSPSFSVSGTGVPPVPPGSPSLGVSGTGVPPVSDPLRVLVVTKDSLEQSNSAYAQGGIAGVLDPEDRFENHIEDTLEAGKGLCEREVVEMVVREAPERIAELLSWGAVFDTEGGRLALTREGGHSHRRVVHALGDATGREVMRAVIDRARRSENVEIWENTFTIDLLAHEGRCAGALVWNERLGRALVWAKQTILATGGAGQLYRETTNPEIATGDGAAIAYRAGAELRDMEFMQFHPTVLYIAGSARYLISEAVRGEGAYLRDVTGHRFMPDYDPRAELAPRDVVTRAIVRQMNATQHPNVYLDLRHLEPERVRQRFPGIARICAQFGLDLARDLIPVCPGAHYMIGGVTVDVHGRSTLPGLWAAGEATSSGLHGANRLGSNSLLEGLVFGARAGEAAGREARKMPDRLAALPIGSPPTPALAHEGGGGRAVLRHEGGGGRAAFSYEGAAPVAADLIDITDIRNSLKTLMWRSAGIVRDRAGLKEAADRIAFWSRYMLPREFTEPAGWELQNMLVVAHLIVEAALAREETRGVHARSDFPETDDARWRRHIALRNTSALGGQGSAPPT